MHAIFYPRWDWSKSMLVKEVPRDAIKTNMVKSQEMSPMLNIFRQRNVSFRRIDNMNGGHQQLEEPR